MIKRVSTLLICFLLLIATAHEIFAQASAFTYQGRLADSGTPVNGNYDLQFALWNSSSGGAQVGSIQTINSVSVSNGVFTVNLDFGAGAFPGATRFLEIAVRSAGVGSFTTLTPRQPITSTPYAVRSLNAATADSVPASGVPSGSANYIQNSATPQATSNFNISGAGTANVLNATTQFNLNGNRLLGFAGPSNLSVGFGAGAAITFGSRNTLVGTQAGAVQTSANDNTFVGYQAGLSNVAGTFTINGAQNTFVGTTSGLSNTTGGGNSFFGFAAGSSTKTGFNNTFLGLSAGDQNGDGSENTVIGYLANVQSPNLFNATAIGAEAVVATSNSLVLGNGLTKVGIGTSAPTTTLHVIGNTGITGSVGIGTTAPTAKLSVVAIGDGTKTLHLGIERAWVFKQFGTGAATALELTADDANNNNKNFVINTQGNVGVGTQGPLDRLHVFGDIRVGVFGTNGCLKNNNGGTIIGTCSSDVRFKRNLVPFGPTLQLLTRLQPKYFFWRTAEFPNKNFGTARETGLIAQEVEQVLPELVSEDSDGYKQVDYSKLPLMLLQAVKEQQKEIEQLRRTVAQLQQQQAQYRNAVASGRQQQQNSKRK